MSEHVSVMVNEVLEALKPWNSVDVVVDATLGLGGHSGNIVLTKLGSDVRGCRIKVVISV